ncbi:hypothetical protein EG329_000809 [Mollisiaceae sp. DMI_Dod_QoI]|nr:hypothetical protein EG329_000809 [Helotiales sp. DMI_Dod_QoI]
MSQSWQDDLALSATYLYETGLTVAIIFGCNDKQTKDIINRIENSGDAIRYPLLVAGIFAEIERKRLIAHVERLVDRFYLRTEALGNETRSWRQIMNCEGEKTSDLLQLYNDSRTLASGLGAVKAQLLNSIALETKRDNAQMRSIATLTMVYLPLTSVASVFSMGVFNWNAEEGQSVITVYFWVFLGIAGGLTLATVAIWLFVTLPKYKFKGRREREVLKLA